jgi:hypothetical protein
LPPPQQNRLCTGSQIESTAISCATRNRRCRVTPYGGTVIRLGPGVFLAPSPRPSCGLAKRAWIDARQSRRTRVSVWLTPRTQMATTPRENGAGGAFWRSQGPDGPAAQNRQLALACRHRHPIWSCSVARGPKRRAQGEFSPTVPRHRLTPPRAGSYIAPTKGGPQRGGRLCRLQRNGGHDRAFWPG